jgi:hypothetical protein
VLCKTKIATQVFGIIFFTLLLIELGSYAVLYLSYGSDGPRHIRSAISKFHPVFSRSKRSTDGNPVPPHQRRGEGNPFRVSTRTGYEFIPGKFYSEHIKIGPDGFICGIPCEEVPFNKPGNEIRFFIFGGSTIAGAYSNTVFNTIPYHLSNYLESDNYYRRYTVRVVNAGVGGWFSSQQVSKLVSQVSLMKPDYVIFLDGHNDFRTWDYDNNYYGRPSDIVVNYHPYDYEVLRGVNRMRSLSGSFLTC